MNKLLITVALFSLSCFIHAQSTIPSNITAKLDSLLHTIYNDTLPGASIAIVENNNIAYEKGYGVSNLQSKAAITTTTNFNIASLTKQFTAMAILQLAESGKLSLDYKLSHFFPGMNKRVANTVAIRNLLTHTSGIIDHYSYADTNHIIHAHNADVYNAIKNIDSLYFTPGTQFRYSNTGFCLLALIIEKVSGMAYNNYMEQYIFKPSGMLHTKVWSERSLIAQRATGYEWDSVQNRFATSDANEHKFFSTEGDGGIYTSIHDYVQWLNALQAGKVFSKSIVDKAMSIEYYIKKESGLGYGFGWFVDESRRAKKVYHSGSNGGFRTYSFNIPGQYSIIIFSNRADIDIEALVQKINSLLYPDSYPFIPIEVLTS